MIERFSTYDKVLLGGAFAMASGTLLPIVRLPILGSINYIAGGKGDGIAVVVVAAAVVLAVLSEYRRVAGTLGLIALGIMTHTLIGLFVFLAKMRAAPSPKDHLFQGLRDLLMASVGIEWGWIPMIGGALAVVLAGFMSGSTASFGAIAKLAEAASNEFTSPDKADATIALYIASQKRSAAKPEPTPTFGKRLI